jgi:hypothetical protein
MSACLNYLEFDCSEEADGVGTFDAMASVAPQRLAALHAEIVRVLAWAEAAFAGARAPLDEGGEWDWDLQGAQEWSVPQTLAYDPSTQRLSVSSGAPGVARHTISLSISGSPAFCEAFRQQFGLD